VVTEVMVDMVDMVAMVDKVDIMVVMAVMVQTTLGAQVRKPCLQQER